MNYDQIREQVRRYYGEKIHAHGATARGVDWNSAASQRMRFAELLRIRPNSAPFSLNDYGCGYGALADYLIEEGCSFTYWGFDISEEMIATARQLHETTKQIRFVTKEDELTLADYSVASGIFNVKLKNAVAEWEDYVLNTLESLNRLSARGFAFNLLTKYSDQEFMRPDLYYGDPLFFFDYCKSKFSRFVSLIHDYPLYEFTILVRKD